jgi:hypothetical protein
LLGAAASAVLVETRRRLARSEAPGWYRYELPIAFAAFAFASPEIAFFMYFGAWHAARHFLRLAAAYGIDPEEVWGSRSRDLAVFALRSLPMTAVALVIALACCLLLVPSVSLTIALAALAFAVTVPHTFAVRFFNRVTAPPAPPSTLTQH